MSIDKGKNWKKLGPVTEYVLFEDVIVNDNDVTFILSNGQSVSVKRSAPLSVTFDAKDLVAMDVNSTRDINYTIHSDAETIDIEVVSSADIKAKAVKADNKSGVIRIMTGQTIDEYSQVIIFVSDGNQIIMRSISFEEAALQIHNSAIKEISSEGGQVELEFLTNMDCNVEIPQEAALWISTMGTKAIEQKSLTINVAENSGKNREADVIVRAVGSSLELVYTISQKADPAFLSQNDREIVIKLATHFKDASLIDYLENTPMKDWGFPIYVNDEERVIGVHLLSPAPALDNDIPDYIKELTELERLELPGVGIKSITDCIGSLKKLRYLDLSSNEISKIPETIKGCEKLDTLYIERNKFNEFPIEVLNLPNLKFLNIEGTPSMNSEIPEDIGNLPDLEYLNLAGCCLSGNIPESLCRLKKMKYLNLSSWPNEFTKFTGGIPEDIGNLNNLEELYLSKTGLSGTIPESLGNLRKLKQLDFTDNYLYGDIPESVTNLPVWKTSCYRNIWQEFNGPTMSFTPNTLNLSFPEFNTTDPVTNAHVESKSVLEQNELTLIFHYSNLPSAIGDTIKELYKKYYNQGLGFVNIAGLHHLDVVDIDAVKKMDMPEAINISRGETNVDLYLTPAAYLFDSEGNCINMMCIEFNSEEFVNDIKAILGEGNGSTMYTSTDYSKDGEIITYQTATVGKGIDLVFMGDAFVDKDMAENGVYEQAMQYMIDEFFAYEPYRSMKNRFNVYAVKVVSPNSVNAVGAVHRINYDPSVCIEYAQKIPGINQERMMITTYISYSGGVSYTSMVSDGSYFAFIKNKDSGVVAHEAGGHGFAGLLDEYVNYSTETVNEEDKTYLDNVWSQYGWGANVDWRNDPAQIKWSHFLSDARYSDENIGIYEGAYLIGYGVYRPTEQSMMNSNDTPFNAPSREQIYKRIMQYSEGADWQYDYEKFVEFDRSTRDDAKVRKISIGVQSVQEHEPPTLIEGTWRDMK